MRRGARRMVWAVMLLCSSPSAALAQAVPAGAAGAAARASEEGATRAKRHHEAGLRLYREGAPLEAAAEFARAYELEPDSKYLVNQAKCLEAHGDYAAAVEALERMLARHPDSPYRRNAERSVAYLEAKLAVAAPAVDGGEDPPPVTLAAEPEPGVRVPAATWALGGVGLAGVLAGAGLSIGAWSEAADIKAKTDAGAVGYRVGEATRRERLRTLDELTVASYVAYGVGGALLVTAVVVAVVDMLTEAPAEGPQAQLVPMPRLAGGGVVVRF